MGNAPLQAPMVVLPGILAEIAQVAGTQVALKIAAAKGGIRVYVPRYPKPEHWLVELCGQEVANVIASQLSAGSVGMEHVVPMGPMHNRASVWRTMKRMRAEGASEHNIARVTGTHYKTVQRVTNGKRKTVDEALRQNDLFEVL